MICAQVDSNAADYFRMMPDGVISKTLIHLMERPPGRTSRHIERIIGSQKTLRLQDLLILATDTESLHPDIDTDIVLSTDFAEIHPWLVVWHGNEVPVLQYLHDHNYVCCRVGINRGGVAAMARRSTRASRGRGDCESGRVRVDGVTVPLDAIDAAPSTATRQRSDAAQVCYKEGHEHWCVGGQRAIAAGLTEFCGCQHIYAGCQAFPADPAATPPPTDED